MEGMAARKQTRRCPEFFLLIVTVVMAAMHVFAVDKAVNDGSNDHPLHRGNKGITGVRQQPF